MEKDNQWFNYACPTCEPDNTIPLEMRKIHGCQCLILRNTGQTTCLHIKNFPSRFCETHRIERLKFKELKNYAQDKMQNETITLEERLQAARDVYWYRYILLNMYNDDDKNHQKWLTETYNVLQSLENQKMKTQKPSQEAITFEQEDEQDGIEKEIEITKQTTVKKTKAKEKENQEHRKHLELEKMIKQFEEESLAYRRSIISQRLNEQARKIKAEADIKTMMEQFKTSTTSNRLFIYEVVIKSQDYDPYFLFVYQSQEHVIIWLEIIFNFDFNWFKETELRIKIPNIKKQSGIIDLDNGIYDTIDTKNKWLSAILNLSTTHRPIAEYSVFNTDNDSSSYHLFCHFNKTNCVQITKVKENIEYFKNPNIYKLMLAFLPYLFLEERYFISRPDRMDIKEIKKNICSAGKNVKAWNILQFSHNVKQVLLMFIKTNEIPKKSLKRMLADAKKNKHIGQVANLSS